MKLGGEGRGELDLGESLSSARTEVHIGNKPAATYHFACLSHEGFEIAQARLNGIVPS